METQLAEMRLIILGNSTDTSKDGLFTIMLNRATELGLNILYPFHEDLTDFVIPSRYSNWQVKCAIELYRNDGKDGIVSYSENQLSWTKDKGGISKDLINELVPYAYVPIDAVDES